MKKEESKLDEKIQLYCKENNIWILKVWGGGMQSSGIPDLLICNNGKFIALETKIGKNKPSKLQTHHICKIRQNGGIAEVVYTYEDAIRIIESVSV